MVAPTICREVYLASPERRGGCDQREQTERSASFSRETVTEEGGKYSAFVGESSTLSCGRFADTARHVPTENFKKVADYHLLF